MPIEPDTSSLRYKTPDAWATMALRDPLALLSDHAHLEKKAAANALELLNRWPEPIDQAKADHWIRTLTVVARDETEHLAQATRLLAKAGGVLSRHHKNPYATGLRELVRAGQGRRELLDRVLVSALIEARSCERFELLARCEYPEGFERLGRFYNGLAGSERGHFMVFLELGALVEPGEIEDRWSRMLDDEARIIAGQSGGSRMHSGFPVATLGG